MNNILIPEELKPFISKKSDIFDYFREDSTNLVANWKVREEFRIGTSWHIPTRELVDSLIEYSPIVSVGSGYAYTESLAIKDGADVIATDVSPDSGNRWCNKGKYHCDVEKLEASKAVKKYKDRNVFMGWPPYDNPMAAKVVKEMLIEKYLIFVGETWGGCTGDDEFFEILQRDFEEVRDIRIPNWYGIHDLCVIYKKIK